jgi:transcriptional regulator GlxA family with amidase domain
VPRTRRIVVLAYPGALAVDVVGPVEVFVFASRFAAAGSDSLPVDGRDDRCYRVEVVAPTAGPVVISSGLALTATAALADVRGPVDTFIVVGGIREGVTAAVRDRALVRQVARVAKRARRVCSVCTGAFVLAAAGLLDGRKATTHWAGCDELKQNFPAIDVDPEPIYTRDGHVYTSAGATTGMDLALALVAEDLGRPIALGAARWLVLFMHRPGGQTQFSARLSAQEAERAPLRELQAWIVEHPGADLSVPALAARVGMSVRNFARAFGREVGATPAAFVETVRVEAARQRLETETASLDEIAERCGFGTVETMRRAFARRLRVAPSAYRARFRTRAALH